MGRAAGFFQDTPWVNHEDAVFARYYFDAYDNWLAGNRSQVPQAWLIAFDSAKDRRTTGSGDLLLGMSAHINRDLPFTLAAVGMVTAEGESRKADHDKVDEFLNMVIEPMLAELAARFDPDTVNIKTPFGVGNAAVFQLVAVAGEGLAQRRTAGQRADSAATSGGGAADRARRGRRGDHDRGR